MEESAEEALRRDETLRIYNSTKEALKIIGDVAREAIAEPLPPPIKPYDNFSTLSTPSMPSMMK
jgi:hypothetical protein